MIPKNHMYVYKKTYIRKFINVYMKIFNDMYENICAQVGAKKIS